MAIYSAQVRSHQSTYEGSFGPVPPLLRRCGRASNNGGAHPTSHDAIPSPDFSCPFPQGVTEKCLKFDGSMEYRPVTNADCHNATASHVLKYENTIVVT
jgi:hypothetical protein